MLSESLLSLDMISHVVLKRSNHVTNYSTVPWGCLQLCSHTTKQDSEERERKKKKKRRPRRDLNPRFSHQDSGRSKDSSEDACESVLPLHYAAFVELVVKVLNAVFVYKSGSHGG